MPEKPYRAAFCQKWTSLFVVMAYHISSATAQCSSSNRRTTEVIALTETIQSFDTPGWRVAYYPNMDCMWILDAGVEGATIVIDVSQALIESSSGCRYDAIIIYNGNSTSDSVNRKLCGRIYDGVYTTVRGRYALVRMKTDRNRQYAGAAMKILYAVENAAGTCSGSTPVISATTDPAYLTSPGYPVSLYNGLACSWTITGAPTTVLYLQIVYSDLEMSSGGCREQILAIYDGTSNLDPAILEVWCDSRQAFPSTQTVYYTTGNSAHLTLMTVEESVAMRHGFKLMYRQNSTAITTTTTVATTTTQMVQVCTDGQTLAATDTWQFFNSINYPNDYYNNINCFWTIEADIGYTINLTIVDSLLEDSYSCISSDVVTVYDGSTASHPVLSSFCGAATPVLQSTGRYVLVNLRTDGAVAFRGFSAKYKTIINEIPSCAVDNLTANFTAQDGPQAFTSPGFPHNYNDSTVTYWMITNPNETQAVAIHVTDSRLEGSVGCRYDNVTIYQGPCMTYPVLGMFCGVAKPTFYYATGAYALVVMTTDGTVNYKGFSIEFYLTDVQGVAEDSTNPYIIGGIITGAVIGAVVLATAVAYGVHRYQTSQIPSPASSRRSSSSDVGVDFSYHVGEKPRGATFVSERVLNNLYS